MTARRVAAPREVRVEARRLVLLIVVLAVSAVRAQAQLAPLVNPGWAQGPAGAAAGGAESGALTTKLANVVNTLETAISTAQEAVYAFQALQQQAQALKSLSSGNWQGFVSAVNEEAQAMGTIDAAWKALPSLGQLKQISQFVASSSYATANQAVGDLAANWANFNNVVEDTDMTARDFSYRAQLEKQIMAEAQASNGDGSVSLGAQLQLTQESLGVVQGDLSDLETTTLAAQTYEEGIHQEAVVEAELDAKAAGEFWYGQNGGAYSSAITAKRMGGLIGIRW